MTVQPIQKQVVVPVPLPAVWDAITNPEKMRDWYFEVKNFQLKEGSEFFFYEPGFDKKFRHVCKIIEIIPNRRFSHTWTFPDFSNGVSFLTWELSEQDGKTHIHLLHVGVENFSEAGTDFARSNFDAGWEEIVTQILVNYLIQ